METQRKTVIEETGDHARLPRVDRPGRMPGRDNRFSEVGMSAPADEAVTAISARPIRILHIGNIANNAYLNAAILNRAGYDCDVLVHDYYHVMGCPEWEESDFSGAIDEFAPDWARVDLAGFQRPLWFAQGPRIVALHYLLARRQGSRIFAAILWSVLRLTRQVANVPRLSIWKSLFRFGLAVLLWNRRVLQTILRVPLRFFNILLCAGRFISRRAVRVVTSPLAWKAQGNCAPEQASAVGLRAAPDSTNPAQVADSNEQRFNQLIETFAQQFPERPDRLSPSDFDHFRKHLPLFQKLFESYDVIHCYGTDPIWPLLAGNRPWIAYEHSTIRHLPFQDSTIGRLTALAYNQADRVIITNCDCYLAAERLKCRDYEFVPHPLNERWIKPGMGVELRQALFAELDADFLCFHPPRQHWEPWRDLLANGSDTDPSWLKANDIFYEGFARFVQEVAPRAAIVTVAWGASVENSKVLLAKLGVERVKWIAPQHSRNMLRYIDSCDVLVDQFWVGAFGTTMPKGMPLGKAAMSYVDPAMHDWCLTEMPPVLNARTPEDVFSLLKHGYQNREWLADVGRQGREWYQRYHSNAVIVGALERLYREAIVQCRSGTRPL